MGVKATQMCVRYFPSDLTVVAQWLPLWEGGLWMQSGYGSCSSLARTDSTMTVLKRTISLGKSLLYSILSVQRELQCCFWFSSRLLRSKEVTQVKELGKQKSACVCHRPSSIHRPPTSLRANTCQSSAQSCCRFDHIYTHIIHLSLHLYLFLCPNFFFYSPSNQLNTLIACLPSW